MAKAKLTEPYVDCYITSIQQTQQYYSCVHLNLFYWSNTPNGVGCVALLHYFFQYSHHIWGMTPLGMMFLEFTTSLSLCVCKVEVPSVSFIPCFLWVAGAFESSNHLMCVCAHLNDARLTWAVLFTHEHATHTLLLSAALREWGKQAALKVLTRSLAVVLLFKSWGCQKL